MKHLLLRLLPAAWLLALLFSVAPAFAADDPAWSPAAPTESGYHVALAEEAPTPTVADLTLLPQGETDEQTAATLRRLRDAVEWAYADHACLGDASAGQIAALHDWFSLAPLGNAGVEVNAMRTLASKWTDPDADRIVFWDDSAGTFTFLTAGTGLSISGTTISVSGATSLTNPTFAAGDATHAAYTLTSGTLQTAATAGGVEFDGKVPYFTSVASSRQALVGEQTLILSSPYTLTSASTQQKLFNGSTAGALTVASATTYEFECYLDLTSMSATSGNLSFSPCGLGASGATATLTGCEWMAIGLDASTPGTAAAASTCNYAGSTADPISTGDVVVAATGTALILYVRGTLRINAGGTIIPSCSLTTAATPAVGRNSFFRCWPIGSNTVVTVGNWN